MIEALGERIRATQTPLVIRAGGSKDFYGQQIEGDILDVSGHRGIVSYEPGELVLTAKCGTPLAEIEALLDRHGQMLGFEPPHFGTASTLGGTLACGLSGPRRPHAGSARDFVLGMEILDGTGQHLKFGGQVIKNVAGYDASRLMVGSLGTLGVLVQASLKVLPKPQSELTLQFELDETTALKRMNEWSGQPLPVSASLWQSGILSLRLSGASSAIMRAQAKLGGDHHLNGPDFWRQHRDHETAFFSGDLPLWRLSLPPSAPPSSLAGKQIITWGGAERWLKTDADAAEIRAWAAAHGGHATLFMGGHKAAGAFHPLPRALMKYHLRLKGQFDPRGMLNRGRMYPDF
ncbi:MAG: glycolate oxidase subunit GlcE [Hydrogenophilaceae bacterium]|nr:glycolate oxidase subunit GlcE [Hydrogenophilaceae bacterium]